MLSGNGVKTVRCSYDALHDPFRLTIVSGNGALVGEPSHHKCLDSIESLELKDVWGRMLLA